VKQGYSHKEHRNAYYQNVMYYSAYRGISIECDILRSTLYFQSGGVVETLEKKQWNAAEFFGFDSLSHQYIFNALS